MAHQPLDTGTNQVEILEFFLGRQSFGLNLAKIMQIVAYEGSKVTPLPNQSARTLGLFHWRENTIPLIDLHIALNLQSGERPERLMVLVTKCNELICGFLIDGVDQIHRLNWEDIHPTNKILERHSTNILASFSAGDKDILLVDIEKMISEFFPEIKMAQKFEDLGLVHNLMRADAKLVFVEDSGFIRKNVSILLREVGYNDVMLFENGLDAFQHVARLQIKAGIENRPITDFVSLIVTDIEMPKMDGLTLCRRVKQELGLAEVPVAIFSSLVDEQMGAKCREVGADIYATKPKINELVTKIDSLLNINT